MALDYLKDLEAASGQRAGDPEIEQRRRDAAAGRYGMFAETGDPMALVIGWQVPKAGVPLGPPPAFLGPRWVAGPAPGLDGAIVLDRQTNKTSILPPASWLVRYEDGGEVAGYDDVTFRESYTYLGEVGSGIRRQRAEEPVERQRSSPAPSPVPPPMPPMPAAPASDAWHQPIEVRWFIAQVTEDNARLRIELAEARAQLKAMGAGPTPGVEETGGLGSHDSQGPTSGNSGPPDPISSPSAIDTPAPPSDTDVSSTEPASDD